jgi:NAD(P)-dependent dehydrogenase (short-subunit alcohol dehydrogenase family)
MKIRDKVVVITGAGSGIGKAMAERFHHEGAAGLVLADQNAEAVGAVARAVDGLPMVVDVAEEADIARLARAAEEHFGRIDLFCSNAGVPVRDPDFDFAGSAPDDMWLLGFKINLMAHVYAARAALPGMIRRGEGYFLNTLSAAALLTTIGSPVYSAVKHGALGFAESLAITHAQDGVRVSIFCPQAVDTPMLKGARGAQSVDGVVSADFAADCVVRGLEAETFLILSHPEVLTYMQRKAADYDRWIRGMVRLREQVRPARRD